MRPPSGLRLYYEDILGIEKNGLLQQWSPTGKARGPLLTPMWGEIPVTRLHIPPRPEAVVSCGRDEGRNDPFSAPVDQN
jgi:hypothetical protein